jgi:hypothetical protein
VGGSGEIPSLRDLSAEVAARQQDVKKVLIVDARSYAAAVGNRQEQEEHLTNGKIIAYTVPVPESSVSYPD